MSLSIKINRPNDVLSEGEHLGYEFVTVNNHGYRCGYVRVPKGHPWHGKDYFDIAVDIHGGELTFSEHDKPCRHGDNDAYWVGFDCAHYTDLPDTELKKLLTPLRCESDHLTLYEASIKTQEYVENECRKLCQQAFNALNPRINESEFI